MSDTKLSELYYTILKTETGENEVLLQISDAGKDFDEISTGLKHLRTNAVTGTPVHLPQSVNGKLLTVIHLFHTYRQARYDLSKVCFPINVTKDRPLHDVASILQASELWDGQELSTAAHQEVVKLAQTRMQCDERVMKLSSAYIKRIWQKVEKETLNIDKTQEPWVSALPALHTVQNESSLPGNIAAGMQVDLQKWEKRMVRKFVSNPAVVEVESSPLESYTYRLGTSKLVYTDFKMQYRCRTAAVSWGETETLIAKDPRSISPKSSFLPEIPVSTDQWQKRDFSIEDQAMEYTTAIQPFVAFANTLQKQNGELECARYAEDVNGTIVDPDTEKQRAVDYHFQRKLVEKGERLYDIARETFDKWSNSLDKVLQAIHQHKDSKHLPRNQELHLDLFRVTHHWRTELNLQSLANSLEAMTTIRDKEMWHLKYKEHKDKVKGFIATSGDENSGTKPGLEKRRQILESLIKSLDDNKLPNTLSETLTLLCTQHGMEALLLGKLLASEFVTQEISSCNITSRGEVASCSPDQANTGLSLVLPKTSEGFDFQANADVDEKVSTLLVEDPTERRPSIHLDTTFLDQTSTNRRKARNSHKSSDQNPPDNWETDSSASKSSAISYIEELPSPSEYFPRSAEEQFEDPTDMQLQRRSTMPISPSSPDLITASLMGHDTSKALTTDVLGQLFKKNYYYWPEDDELETSEEGQELNRAPSIL